MADLEATVRTSLEGRYAIEGEIGRGGMSVVYRAHDVKHNRSVAIKVLKPEFSAAVGTDRFHREIEIVAGLTHPHILPLHDSGEIGDLLYYVMPYIERGSLGQKLEKDGRLSIPDALRLTRQVADALGFAHRHGVVHRDVKPANILLSEEHALLADFGIAHLAETEGGTLTGTGLALGTPAYFSPEQATAERDLDGRSDIYSLGCVLYEALAGQPPFEAASVRALIGKHLTEEPPRVRRVRPEVSEGVEAVVLTALQKEPEKRFQTAEEMAGSLDLLSGGFEAMVAVALRKLLGPRYKWLHGKRLAGLVAGAVLVLLVGGFLLRDVLRGPGYAGAHPRYAVLPYEGEELTEEELRLSQEAAKELYWHLGNWESITVVPSHAMEGPRLRVVQAGFEAPTVSLNAGLELLATLNATHLIYVQAKAAGDSVNLEASIYARGSREPEILRGRGLRTEMELISAGLALQILGVQGEAAEEGDLVRRSPFHQAHQEFRAGRAALEDWRLKEAEDHFRKAVEQDSTFAAAHYQLALTMYWRTVRDPERILTGEAIQYHVGRADRFGNEDRLRPGERRDLNAFRAFWAGDYEAARGQYAEILRREPTNLDALLLAGAVEFQDPWAAANQAGELTDPRGDWNRARAMFDSAVVLTPHIQMAWGQLFEIDREVARVALKGRCLGFLPPGGPLVPPYLFPEAAETKAYCPYIEDGLIRWGPDSLSTALYERTAREAWQMRDATVDRLDNWARVERDQARPHEELSDWMLWERAVRGCGADPMWADSLLVEALDHTERALAIRGDTTPEDMIRLGGLRLATGEVSRAVDLTERALAALGDWQTGAGTVPPKSAANVYLAVGRGHPTVEILEAVEDKSTWSVPDSTVELGSIQGGPVWGAVNALYALGMTGDDEAGIGRRFRTLEQTWAGLGYSERQQALLRSATTSMVSAALLRQPGMWTGWFEDWEEFGLEIPPVWKGLMAAEEAPDEARSQLAVAIEKLRDRPPGQLRAAHYYMPIQLAGRLGEESTVAELTELTAGCPLRLDNVDFGWGMRRYLADD